MNIAEALGAKFVLVLNGQRKEVLGINMPDNQLKSYKNGEKVPADLKMAAGLLLQYTTATLVEGKTVRQTIEQPAPAAPVALKSTPNYVARHKVSEHDMGVSEFDTFDQLPPDDGEPRPGMKDYKATPVTCQECGAPLPMHAKGCLHQEAVAAPAPGVVRVKICPECGSVKPSHLKTCRMAAPLVPAQGVQRVTVSRNTPSGTEVETETIYVGDVVVPEWAKRLEAKVDDILFAMQHKQPPPAPAAGGGQGGAGGSLHIVKIHIKPKKGKVAIDFYDDDPDHQYPEVRETREAHRWANTLPKGIEVSDEQVIKVSWDLVYKLSSNLTEKGNPYKDVVSITPRK